MELFFCIAAGVFVGNVAEKLILSFYVMRRQNKARRKALAQVADFDKKLTQAEATASQHRAV